MSKQYVYPMVIILFYEIFLGFSGLRENIFPSPVIYRPKCGVCGRHTILNGDLSAVINFGARSIRHSSLLDSTFTERVSVSSNGTVLVEAGMPKQEPEMVSQRVVFDLNLIVFFLVCSPKRSRSKSRRYCSNGRNRLGWCSRMEK